MRPLPDHDASPLARALAATARLGCSPSEAVALATLAAAALAGLGLLWWVVRPEPVAPPPGAAAHGLASGDEAAEGGDAAAGDGAAPPAGGIDVRDGEVVVHVAGEVERPGLYELPGGARVADALDAAGGPLPGALLDHLNLARPLSDGEQLRVPGPDDLAQPDAAGPGAPTGGAPAGPSPWRPDGTLDLNLATEADLQELPGIGPVMSERIVAHRDEIGGFTAVGQLREVPGIGEKTFQSLAELVSV